MLYGSSTYLLSLSLQGLRPLIDSETMSVLDELYNVTDEYTDRWLSSGKYRIVCFLWFFSLIVPSDQYGFVSNGSKGFLGAVFMCERRVW